MHICKFKSSESRECSVLQLAVEAEWSDYAEKDDLTFKSGQYYGVRLIKQLRLGSQTDRDASDLQYMISKYRADNNEGYLVMAFTK